jgi:hypothetical protein
MYDPGRKTKDEPGILRFGPKFAGEIRKRHGERGRERKEREGGEVRGSFSLPRKEAMTAYTPFSTKGYAALAGKVQSHVDRRTCGEG